MSETAEALFGSEVFRPGAPREKDEVLTAKEAADFLKISTLTLRKKIREDELPAHRMGRKWVLIKSEVLEWLRRQ